MNLNLKYFVNDFIGSFFISKLSNLKSLPELNFLIIRINLDNLKDQYDSRILDSLELLYEITGLRPHICYMVDGYKKGTRVFRFSCKVTLQGKHLLKFLLYFIRIVYLFNLSGQLKLIKKFDFIKGSCMFSFKNISLFRGLSERIYLFKDLLYFEFYFKYSSKNLSNLYLNCIKL